MARRPKPGQFYVHAFLLADDVQRLPGGEWSLRGVTRHLILPGPPPMQWRGHLFIGMYATHEGKADMEWRIVDPTGEMIERNTASLIVTERGNIEEHYGIELSVLHEGIHRFELRTLEGGTISALLVKIEQSAVLVH